MKKKPFFKSKTINSALVIILISVMGLLGVGEKQIAATYDTVSDGGGSDNATELITLIGGITTIHGRYTAKGGIGKDEDPEKQ